MHLFSPEDPAMAFNSQLSHLLDYHYLFAQLTGRLISVLPSFSSCHLSVCSCVCSVCVLFVCCVFVHTVSVCTVSVRTVSVVCLVYVLCGDVCFRYGSVSLEVSVGCKNCNGRRTSLSVQSFKKEKCSTVWH